MGRSVIYKSQFVKYKLRIAARRQSQANSKTTPQGPVAIHPSGKFLFAGSNGLGGGPANVGSSVDNGSPFPTGPNPSWVLVEPQGHFVYVSNNLGVSAYEIDGSNGALTPVNGSPFSFAFGGRISFSY
jgi:DNA-binding beta-propeller fold protein YncE